VSQVASEEKTRTLCRDRPDPSAFALACQPARPVVRLPCRVGSGGWPALVVAVGSHGLTGGQGGATVWVQWAGCGTGDLRKMLFLTL
jgi:hypothetical protein